MDKSLNYLALARKGGRVELGEEPVGAVARAGKAYLIIVASDAGDHTWRRAKSYVAGTDQQCLKIAATKDELGLAIGRTSLAIAAFTDAALALAFVKATETPDPKALEVLENKVKRLKTRQQEAKAHKRNVRFGKK
ncbi:MAG: 50S ribosomal protein L7 [Oscillospiraceae bacterium]|nr:50S ribosomal protein L7 [Oscillospiraceae bacterium]